MFGESTSSLVPIWIVQALRDSWPKTVVNQNLCMMISEMRKRARANNVEQVERNK